ncbi:hypothetical protein, partial [Nonomuraea sp. NPDC049784]|uniref:hypothetical protein n=1 Tax=Nonomuraea sp. NPDC049784 TaxID=3154361 RepID=UPI0033D17DC5
MLRKWPTTRFGLHTSRQKRSFEDVTSRGLPRVMRPGCAIRPQRRRAPFFVGGLGQDVAMTVTARLDLAIFDAADIEKVG